MIQSLVQLSDHVWQRLRTRLDGLGDEEYHWVPVDRDPPVTTIAWRMHHVTACYGAKRNRAWLGLPLPEDTGRFDEAGPTPSTADAALVELAAAHALWREMLVTLDDQDMGQALGPIAGPYAEADKGGFVLHQLDEVIHHAAEVALLRDLWRAGLSGPASG